MPTNSLWVRLLARVGLGLALLAIGLAASPPVYAGWRSLTGPLPAHTTMFSSIFSPDSNYFVFIADIEVDERYELYSVPITGTKPTRLNPALVAGGRVSQFAITPDSQYVIYKAKQEEGQSISDLYRVPIAGGQAVKLNVGPVSGRHVADFSIDPDNVRVVYRGEHQVEDQMELFSVPIAGGEGVKLNRPLVAGGDVFDFKIDPHGNQVVYHADQDENGRHELYGVPITGGMAVKLNPPNSRVSVFGLTPQAPFAVFQTRLDGSTSNRLYMNPTGGGLLILLNYPLASNESVIGFNISPDGKRVVYNVRVSTPSTPNPSFGNLYSVPFDGGDSTLLTTSADPGYGVASFGINIMADSQRVVYFYQKNAMANKVFESVALNSANRALLYDRGAGESIDNFDLSPNSQWIVYNTYPSYQAYAIPAAGGTRIPLGKAIYPRILPDSSRILYYVVDASGKYDLYSMKITGGETRNLSRMDDQADINDSSFSPDGRWVVFGVTYKNGNHELRVSDGAEAQPPTPTPPSTGYRVYLPLIVR